MAMVKKVVAVTEKQMSQSQVLKLSGETFASTGSTIPVCADLEHWRDGYSSFNIWTEREGQQPVTYHARQTQQTSLPSYFKK